MMSKEIYELNQRLKKMFPSDDSQIDEMQSAINTFCKKSDWCADGWKEQPWIKALFDLRSDS